ncbi:MAG TPA: SMC-Scp complex subunit ScpB [Thermomicrobiaceae bacterium]|nr:SMC-Scp complex subunit ScpB [Thermomicrobiaceae bacterium]
MGSDGGQPGGQLTLASFEEVDAEALPPALGALLFLCQEPEQLSRLATVLRVPVEEIRPALEHLEERLEAVGLCLHWVGDDAIQLATASRFAALTRRFLGLDRPVRLSQAALETTRSSPTASR